MVLDEFPRAPNGELDRRALPVLTQAVLEVRTVSTLQPSSEWDDSIELGKWIDALVRYKWLILASTMVAVVAAAIIGYIVQTPTFESTGGATFPSADGAGGLGLTLRGYQEFATSTSVMDAVRQKLGLETSAGQLRARYTFQLEKDEQFITIKASAETADEAFLLARQWIDAYDEEIQAVIREQLTSLKDDAKLTAGRFSPQLTEAEDNLTRFDLENPITTLEARLSALEAELSSSEARQRELTRSLIPVQEATLASLRSGPHWEPGPPLGGGGSLVGVPALVVSADELEPSNETTTNPVYLELSQGLIRVRLALLEKELVGSESRLRQLTWSSIPLGEARLVSLQDALDGEAQELSVLPTSEGTPQGIPSNGDPRDKSTMLNPAFRQLRQKLLETRVSWKTDQREA